jgi:hypothetical protein
MSMSDVPSCQTTDTPLGNLANIYARHDTGRIPLWLKLAYTAFMAVLIPVYWTHYGVTNFLYFCDLALILTLIGMWRENPLLVSMPAVGILAPQILWIVDYLLNFAGIQLTGMTDYMFDASQPLYLRGLSLFHGWLPMLLVFGVMRLGYDTRAFAGWTALAWTAMLISYIFLPEPSAAAAAAGEVANVNYVFGMSSAEPQTFVAPIVWLLGLMIALPALMFAPVHLALKRLWPAKA